MKRLCSNTPVADPDRPLEILRTIHSFDPCLGLRGACDRCQGQEVFTAEGGLTGDPMPVAQPKSFADARHPDKKIGPAVAVYVWQYPLRLVHWGMVISIGVLVVHRLLHPRPVHRGPGAIIRS